MGQIEKEVAMYEHLFTNAFKFVIILISDVAHLYIYIYILM